MSLPNVSPHVPLTQRVIGAGAWTLVGYGAGFAIRLGSNLLLTRLLAPEMFGVVSVGFLVLYGLVMFCDLGLNQNIVRSQRGNQPAFFNTVWTAQILRGLLVWLMMIAISVALKVAVDLGLAPQGSVYADPSLPRVLSLLSAVVLIEGFGSTKIAQSRRSIQLGRLTQIGLAGQLVGVCCMLAWAYFDRSIWALVVGGLGSSLTKTILSHTWLEGEQNRLQWDHSAFREIFEFGKWIFLSSILGFFVASGDRLILGGLVAASTLGVYSIAFTLANSLETVVVALATGVAFPALSEVSRDRPHHLQRTYYKFHRPLALLCYFCSGVLVCGGQDLIKLLYDGRYVDAGWMLEVLAVGAISYPLQVAVQVFLALGAPKVLTRVLLIRLVGLGCGIPAGFYWFGLPGAVWGIVASQLLPLIPTFFWLKRLSLLSVKSEIMILGALPLGLGVGWLFSVAVAAVR